MVKAQSLRAASSIETRITAPRRSSIVLVVEQHLVLRRAIAVFLRDQLTSATVVRSVAADDHVQLTHTLTQYPQIILVGRGSPAKHGLTFIAQVRAALPDAAIVAFCWWDDDAYQQSAQGAGADALFCTDKLSTQLPDMIQRLLGAER